jgi:NADH dehydrogenase
VAFERAELTHDDAERQRLLTFVIVGGGATGVEMAGAIADIARQTLANDFRRIDPRSSRIILLEAGSSRAAHPAGGSVGLCRAGADAAWAST